MNGTGSPRPTFSIVTAAYNAAPTLAETISSVMNQTRDDWELIVVDDGSSDDTASIAERLAAEDERIRVLRQQNAGAAAARNAGLAVATGEWLCVLDADDLLLPRFLEHLSKFIDDHPGYDIYSPNGSFLLQDGGSAPIWRGREWERVREVRIEDEICESLIPIVSLMRPSVVGSTGGFRDVYSEDYDFWLRALIRGARQIHDPEVLWRYRRREGSKTRQLVAEAESILQILRDACSMPELTEAARLVCDEAIAFAHARIDRRRLEEAVLEGRYAHARRSYIAARGAFPQRGKYLLGLAIILVSPALYASLKRRTMV